jgi:hypothetical protein
MLGSLTRNVARPAILAACRDSLPCLSRNTVLVSLSALTSAIRCHRNGNYLAACVLAGAAGESILLAVAIAKTQDEPKILKDYASAGGRGRVTKLVVSTLKGSVARTFEAALQVLHYWRDDAAHGMATTISEVEAYASLTQLLRLAQFCSDHWVELIA